MTSIVADERTNEHQDRDQFARYSQSSARLLCPNSTPLFLNFSCMRKYNVQFLPIKIRVVSPSRVLNEEWSYATCTPSPLDLASWRLFRCSGCSASTPLPTLHQLYQSALTFPPRSHTSRLSIYIAQRLSLVVEWALIMSPPPPRIATPSHIRLLP